MATTATSRRASGVEPGAAAVPELALARDLYERHSHTIFAFCYSRLGSREDAEDAAQTTFLNAFRSLQRGVVPELELAWLMKIAKHAILNRRRAASRRRRVETPHDPEILQGVAPAHERDADELIGLDRALASMPAQQRRALLLREWQGLSYREIREELDLSEAALEALLFRARRSLASGLEQPHRLHTKRRFGFGLGGLLTGAKALLTGGASSQLAVGSIAVIGTVVGATVPVHQSPRLPGPSPASAAAPLATVLGGVHTRGVGALLPSARRAPAAAIASLPRARRIAHPVESSYPAAPTAEPSEAGTVPSALPPTEATPEVAPSSMLPSDPPPTAPLTPRTEMGTTVPLPLQSDLLAAALSVPPSDARAAGTGSPGQSANAPGRTGQTPANGSPPPGASGVAPGKSNAAGGGADGNAAPGNSVSAPGRTGVTAASGPPPGNGGVAPGKSGAAGEAPDATAAPGKSGSPPGAGTDKNAETVAGAPAANSTRADSQTVSTGVAGTAGAVPAAGNGQASQSTSSGTATGGGSGGARHGDTSPVAVPSGATSGSAGAASAAGAAASVVDPRSSATGDSSTGNSNSGTTNDGGTQKGNQTPNGNASAGADATAGNPTEPSPTSGASAAQPSATSTGNGSKGASSGSGKAR